MRHAVRRLVVSLVATATLAAVGFSLRAVDLDEVLKSGKLRHLGIPYANFVTGSGDGMDVDLMKGFAESLGVEYEYVKEDWGTIFEDLAGRRLKAKGDELELFDACPVKGDLAANGITVLPWREKAVDFSRPTFANQVWLVARADSSIVPITPSKSMASDISATRALVSGRSLLGKGGTCLDPSLYRLEAKAGNIVLFKGSLNEVAPALLNGDAELALLDVPDALVALQKWPGQLKILGPVSGRQDMAVAFPKSSPKLLAAFNEYLARSKADGSYGKLLRKYYPYVFDCFPGILEPLPAP